LEGEVPSKKKKKKELGSLEKKRETKNSRGILERGNDAKEKVFVFNGGKGENGEKEDLDPRFRGEA